MHDSLTGLPDRERMHEVLDRILPGATEQGLVVVALMDLDDFKDVNDTLGHTTGDALLEEIARRLAAAVGARGTVARLGGDEFTVALCCMHSQDEAVAYIESLKAEVEAPVRRRPAHPGGALQHRCRHRSHPRHRAPDPPPAGRHRHVLGQEGRLGCEALRRGARHVEHPPALPGRRTGPALANGDFQLFYQPQLDLHTGTVSALEALARWPTPSTSRCRPTSSSRSSSSRA